MKKGKEIKCCDTQRRIPCPQLCLHIWAVPQLSRDSFCLHLYRLIVFFSFFFPIRYTSVGNRSNTQPNAALRVVDPLTGSETYRPAYLLHDCLTERQGRLWRAVPSSLYLGPPQGSSVRLHKDVSWSPSSTADTFFEYYTHPQFSLNLYCVQRVFSSTSYRSKYIHMEWCSGAFYSKKKGRVRLFFVVTPWCCHEASSSGCYHPTWVTDVMDVEKRESSSW